MGPRAMPSQVPSLPTSPSLEQQRLTKSAASIKFRIKKLIEQEDPSSPISDDAIVETLQQDGVSVARRTVAKYRKMENIPSSFARKRRNIISGATL